MARVSIVVKDVNTGRVIRRMNPAIQSIRNITITARGYSPQQVMVSPDEGQKEVYLTPRFGLQR